MDGEAVKKIAELTERGMFKEVDGMTFSNQRMTPVLYAPHTQTLELHTLSGLKAYLESDVDRLEKSRLIIHVVDHTTVRLESALFAIDRCRDRFIEVCLDPELKKFPFEQFMGHEEFQIKLRSMFVPAEDLELLLQFTSRLTINNGIEMEDDGVTQHVGVKQGMSGARVETVSAPSIISLQPYRTFREIEQPASTFLFRMKAVEGKVPVCALFESDGGAWRNEAIKRIASWCTEQIPSVAVVA